MYEVAVRRLVLAELSSGRSVASVSREFRISRSTIAAWAEDPQSIVPAPTGCFRCDALELADPEPYLYLLGQYLGDGHLTLYHRVPKLRIACAGDYPGIATQVDAALASVSGNRVQIVQARGCAEHCTYWMHWPCLLPQHGPGRKHERPIRLEAWQEQLIDTNPWPFVRGLIHSDGCRSINIVRRGDTEYRYPRYFFSNESRDIRDLFTASLDRLGVRWRLCRPNLVAVSRRPDVAVLDRHIGPKT